MSRIAYEGRAITVTLEPVTLPNGHRIDLDVVRHPGASAIVPFESDDVVLLIHQYRHCAGGMIWEVPAGKLDGDEPPRAAAERELAEETGLAAGGWESLGAMVSSPGVFTERVHLFLATELVHGVAAPEHGELYELHWVALDQAVRKARDGAIEDAKTVIALWRAAARLGVSVVG